MRKMAVVFTVAALLTAACGDDDGGGDGVERDPAAIDTCEGIADATIAMTQDIIDTLGDLTPEELAAVSGGEVSPEFQTLAEEGAALGTRAGQLQCTDLDALVTERADQLEAAPENAIGQLVIEGIKSGEDVMGRLFR